jgi:hypothetical protein
MTAGCFILATFKVSRTYRQLRHMIVASTSRFKIAWQKEDIAPQHAACRPYSTCFRDMYNKLKPAYMCGNIVRPYQPCFELLTVPSESIERAVLSVSARVKICHDLDFVETAKGI